MSSPRSPSEFFDAIVVHGDYTPYRSRKRSSSEKNSGSQLDTPSAPSTYPFQVPVELWRKHVFQFLRVESQFRAITEVCKLWKNEFSPLVESLTISCPHHAEAEKMSDSDECEDCSTHILPRIFARFTGLRRVRMACCSISPRCCVALGPHISVVDIRSSWKRMGDEDVERLACAIGIKIRCILLPEAQIDGDGNNDCGSMLSDAALFAIAKHCPRVECIALNGCTECTGTGLSAIALGCPNVECLGIARYGRCAGRRTYAMAGEISYTTPVARGIVNVAARCKRLKHVCWGFVDASAAGQVGWEALTSDLRCPQFSEFGNVEATLTLDPCAPWCLDASAFRPNATPTHSCAQHYSCEMGKMQM